MSYSETFRGVEYQSKNGTILRCFAGESDTLTFQILHGTKGIESVFEPTDKKDFGKLLTLVALWIGLEDARKIIESLEKKKGRKKDKKSSK